MARELSKIVWLDALVSNRESCHALCGSMRVARCGGKRDMQWRALWEMGSTAGARGGNNSNSCKDSPPNNGSRQGQNLAVTVLHVPNSLDRLITFRSMAEWGGTRGLERNISYVPNAPDRLITFRM